MKNDQHACDMHRHQRGESERIAVAVAAAADFSRRLGNPAPSPTPPFNADSPPKCMARRGAVKLIHAQSAFGAMRDETHRVTSRSCRFIGKTLD